MILISNPTSLHTVNWVDGFTSQGFDVNVVYEEFWKTVPMEPELLVDTIPLKTMGGFPLMRKSLSKLRFRSIVKDLPAKTNINQRLDFLAPQLDKIISDLDADLVHANGLQAAAILANRSSFRPYTISIYGSDILLTPSKKPHLVPLMKKALDESQLIHVQGDTLVEKVKALSPSSSQKIMKATWGADTNLFRPDQPQDLLSKLNLPKARRILSCRALFPLYRVSTIIQSFSALSKDFADIVLIIGGQGPEQMKLKQMVEDLDLTSQVFFTGYLDKPTMSQLFSTVDIYVQFPESDGVSITAMEAMSSGLPIISSDVGDVPTLVKDGENGFLVDPNSTDALTQAIRKLLQNTQLQEKMGKESRDEAVTNHDRTKFFGSIAQRMKTIASNVS